MATRVWTVVSLGGGAVFIDLLYDDVTLAVSTIQARNQSASAAFISVQNSRQPSQRFSGTLAAGGTRAIAVPAGAFTLGRVPALGGGGSDLSYAPWTVSVRWPA